MAVLYYRQFPGTSSGEFVNEAGQVAIPEHGDVVIVDEVTAAESLQHALETAHRALLDASRSVVTCEVYSDTCPDDYKEEYDERERPNWPHPRSSGRAVKR